MIRAIQSEIRMRTRPLLHTTVRSIYFGGGTPSLLTYADLKGLFDAVRLHMDIPEDAEITLEANPDDITTEKLAEWQSSGINRLSLGIQSFSDADLSFMHRAHDAGQAMDAITMCLEAGFRNLTIDLIYGTPTLPDAQWEANLAIAGTFGIPHLSCYALTREPGTLLNHQIGKGKIRPLDEDQAARQFDMLMAFGEEHNYQHYEISNFAQPGFESRHNTGYWSGLPYMGFGPSAHSFNGLERQWNISNNALYIKALQQGRIPCEKEILSDEDRYNEYVMTGIRTRKGVSEQKIWSFGKGYRAHFLQEIKKHLESGAVARENGFYRLSREARFFADGIAADLFIIN